MTLISYVRVQQWRNRPFDNLQILFRRDGRVAFFDVGIAKQVAAVATLFGVALLIALCGLRMQHFAHVVAQRTRTLGTIERQRNALAAELADLRTSISQVENRLDALDKEKSKLADRLLGAQRQIAAIEDRHQQEQFQRQATTEANGDKALAAAQQTIAALEGERQRLIGNLAADRAKLLQIEGALNAESVSGLAGDRSDLSRRAASTGDDGERQKLLETLVAILPLRAPLDHYLVTSPFGSRIDPFNHEPSFHPGIDLAAPFRTPIYSTAPGVVVFAGEERGYGLLVKIDHGHDIMTLYSHLARIDVVEGQAVPTHFPLGELGSTGRSTGPHIFYEIRVDGKPVDPTRFLSAGGNVIRVGARQ